MVINSLLTGSKLWLLAKGAINITFDED